MAMDEFLNELQDSTIYESGKVTGRDATEIIAETARKAMEKSVDGGLNPIFPAVISILFADGSEVTILVFER